MKKRAAVLDQIGKEPLPRGRSSGGATKKREPDRKSTRLNSSHLVISYAVFCLKNKTSPIYGPTASSLYRCHNSRTSASARTEVPCLLFKYRRRSASPLLP